MKFVLFTLAFFALTARADFDLDSDFMRAVSAQDYLRATGVPSFANAFTAFSPGWDGSNAFPPIVRQAPFGACQSFSITAMMEYLFFRETGKTLKLSEKQIAYSLLKLMTDDFWNGTNYENKPQLGLGIAPYMIEAVHRSGLMPSSDYPWGEYESAEGSRTIDLPLFDKIFEKPEKDYSREEYLKYLDEAFLAAPPAQIRYTFKTLNFSKGKEEDFLVKSPAELRDVTGFAKSRFEILHNSEFNPTYHPKKQEQIKSGIEFFEQSANHFGLKNATVPAAQINEAIVKSLNERMVVLLAADVWTGSWTEKLLDDGGGGHAMVIVGYQIREGELYFKIRNSWGTKMGVEGYNFIHASLLQPNIYYVILFH